MCDVGASSSCKDHVVSLYEVPFTIIIQETQDGNIGGSLGIYFSSLFTVRLLRLQGSKLHSDQVLRFRAS